MIKVTRTVTHLSRGNVGVIKQGKSFFKPFCGATLIMPILGLEWNLIILTWIKGERKSVQFEMMMIIIKACSNYAEISYINYIFSFRFVLCQILKYATLLRTYSCYFYPCPLQIAEIVLLKPVINKINSIPCVFFA